MVWCTWAYKWPWFMCKKSYLFLVSLQLQSYCLNYGCKWPKHLAIELYLYWGFKEGPNRSNRNLINYKQLSPEKKANLFAFLTPFCIVFLEKEVKVGSPEETEALIRDSPDTSCVFWKNHGPSMSQLLVFKIGIDNISPYFMMMLWKHARLWKAEVSGALHICKL